MLKLCCAVSALVIRSKYDWDINSASHAVALLAADAPIKLVASALDKPGAEELKVLISVKRDVSDSHMSNEKVQAKEHCLNPNVPP